MKIEIKFGLITIVVGILWVMIEQITGLNTTYFEEGDIARMLFAFLPFIFLALGIKTKKKIAGEISFLAAWRTGSLIALVYSIGFAIWFWIYASFINLEFLQKAVAWENKKVLTKGLSGQLLEEALKNNTRMYGGSAASYFMLFLSFFVMGVIASAIIALFVKSKKRSGLTPKSA